MYRPSGGNRPYVLGGILGVGVCLLIFLLIPLSQMLSESPEAVHGLQQVAVSLPPPPPPPPDPPPPPPEEEPPPPELREPPPMPTLAQIEVSLNPGTGGALTVGLGQGFSFETEGVEDLRDLFDFGELDETPRIVQRGSIEYPVALRRAGTEGEVQLVVIIDEEGRVTVDEVAEFTHRPFIQAAVRGAEATRFSTPLRNGRPVRARYLWLIRFNLAN